MQALNLCDSCKATGLAYMLAMPMPVPKGKGPALPSWVDGKALGLVPLSGYQYTLRSPRKGFVYVFFEKNHQGSNKWAAWTVSDDGRLFLMPDPNVAIDISQFACNRPHHTNRRLQMLVIDKPHKCERTSWVAFSETQWSSDTRDRYTNDAALRAQRMRPFKPQDDIKTSTPSGPNMAAATEAALQAVIDYTPGAIPHHHLPYALAPARQHQISTDEDGSFDLTKLQALHSTRFPWPDQLAKSREPDPARFQPRDAAEAVKLMGERSFKADGSPHPGVILALPDALGCALELNGWRNDVAGAIARYRDERGLQITAANTVEGLEEALKSSYLDDLERPWRWSPAHTERRRKGIKPSATPEEKEIEADLCRRWEADALARVPERIAKDRDRNVFRGKAAYQADQAQIDADIKAYKTNLQNNPQAAKRKAGQENFAQRKAAENTKKYRANIDETAYTTFKKNWDDFLTKADAEIDKRTVELIKWLEASALLAVLEDFAPTNVADGLLFEDTIGSLVMGMGSTKAGRAKLDEWVKEMKATAPNLFWRAVALNQKAAMDDLDAALAEAKQHENQRTVATAQYWGGVGAKLLKGFADTYKKADSVLSANTKALAQGGTAAYGVRLNAIRTMGFDGLMATAGASLLERTRINGALNYVSEGIIQKMLLIRGYLNESDVKALLVAQTMQDAKGQLAERAAFLKLGGAAVREAKREHLREAWSAVAQNAPSDHTKALKDARLALLVMLFEGLNTFKLITETQTKGDGKTYAALAASGLTLASGLFDIASAPAKVMTFRNLPGESATYQQFKLLGGICSAGASAIGVVIDYGEFQKNKGKGNMVLASLYATKTGAGIFSAGLTAASTFTYAAPVIQKWTGQRASAVLVGKIGERAAAIIAARILFMGAGMWLTVGTLAVQGLIWIFEPDALEDWATLCALGKDRKADKRYRTEDEQLNALQQALISVGFAQ